MLDPRVYRLGWVIAALTLVVLAFSLTDQPAPLRASLSPAAFDGANVSTSLDRLATADPDRRPGSAGDRRLAETVDRDLATRVNGFAVARDTFSAQTPGGARTLENVVATRPGTEPGEGALVVVAARDAAHGPARAALSGTATLIELARDLGGETLDRTVVLASVSGSSGGAGVTRLIDGLRARGPVDAVLVLGDLASAAHRQPTVVPWSDGRGTAPLRLRSTVSTALGAAGSVPSRDPGVLAQLAHLAFPLTVSAQGPFGAAGMPAVDISLSGERGPAADAPVGGSGALTAAGRAVLSAVSALDTGTRIAAPSSDVVLDGRVVPSWAISLFVLGLLAPVLLTALDGVARARRRRQLGPANLGAVLAAAAPFGLALLVVELGRAVGAFTTTPAPTGPGAVTVHGGAITVLAIAAVGAGAAAGGAWLAFRRGIAPRQDARAARRSRGGRDRQAVDHSGDGTAAAMLLVLSLVAVGLWIIDPFAAALLVPALHLWLWAVDSDLALPTPIRMLMVLAGALPAAGLVVFYGRSLGFSAPGVAWEAVLLVASHDVSALAAVLWCLALGCGVSALALALAGARRPVSAPVAMSVRGPVGYAGPGSLGGTKSALRR